MDWCLSTESNCGHKDFSPLLYQLSYRGVMATRMGLEPTTSAVTGRHSNQLNHRANQLRITLYRLKPILSTSFYTFFNLPMQPSVFPLYAPAKPAAYPPPARCQARQKRLWSRADDSCAFPQTAHHGKYYRKSISDCHA